MMNVGHARRMPVGTGRAASWLLSMTYPDPFKGSHSSPEIIRLAVMVYVRFPLSLRNVEDLLHERGVAISHETVRYWWHRFPHRTPPGSSVGVLHFSWASPDNGGSAIAP